MRILIFDTETGGTNPYYNDILQLSYQIIDGETFHVVREANYYFPWPEDKRRVQWGAIQVNGLTEEFLATQDLYDRYEVLNDFIDELIECNLCVAHNGDFDKGFINATARREGIYSSLTPQLHSRSATYIKRNGLLIRKTAIKSSHPFQCAYYPLTPQSDLRQYAISGHQVM